MPTYNGHPNWNHWNVSLWIANDEGLYRLALDCKRLAKNRREAAGLFLDAMEENPKTPDGARYTITTVMHALKGLE